MGMVGSLLARSGVRELRQMSTALVLIDQIRELHVNHSSIHLVTQSL
jgi:hypothetical protein